MKTACKGGAIKEMNSVPNDLQTWKRFVKDGVLDEARLRKRIAESWHRCKKAEVNPYLENTEGFTANGAGSAVKKAFILPDDRKALPRKTAACHKRNGNDGAVN